MSYESIIDLILLGLMSLGILFKRRVSAPVIVSEDFTHYQSIDEFVEMILYRIFAYEDLLHSHLFDEVVDIYKEWFDPNWNYRKSHEILGSQSGSVTDYQMRVTVHYGSGTDSGEHVYLNGKCRVDFGDVRFTAGDKLTLLNYWIENKVDGDYAVFWVKIPSIPAYPDKTYIYIYYGNPNATSISSGVNTFVRFDNFNGDGNIQWTNLTLEYFEGRYVLSRVAGLPDIYGALPSIDTSIIGICLEFTYYHVSLGAYGPRALIFIRHSETNNGYMDRNTIGEHATNAYNLFRYYAGSGTVLYLDGRTFSTGVWYRNYFKRASDLVEGTMGASTVMGAIDTYINGFDSIVIGAWDSGNKFYMSFIAVRRSLKFEPTHGGWGEEETK